MSTVQQRLAAVAETAANLKAQLRELDRLRDQVRKAQQSTQRTAPQRPQAAPPSWGRFFGQRRTRRLGRGFVQNNFTPPR
jgi:hypothetical protein